MTGHGESGVDGLGLVEVSVCEQRLVHPGVLEQLVLLQMVPGTVVRAVVSQQHEPGQVEVGGRVADASARFADKVVFVATFLRGGVENVFEG